MEAVSYFENASRLYRVHGNNSTYDEQAFNKTGDGFGDGFGNIYASGDTAGNNISAMETMDGDLEIYPYQGNMIKNRYEGP